MDTCAVETGLFKKKPCGHPAVAKCANCEMALCSSHGVAVLSATKQKTGKMVCSECDKAQKASDKAAAAADYGRPPPPIKKPAPGAAPAHAAAAPKPAPAAAAKPAAAAAPKPAPLAAAAKPDSGLDKKPAQDDIDAPLEFTPSKKK